MKKLYDELSFDTVSLLFASPSQPTPFPEAGMENVLSNVGFPMMTPKQGWSSCIGGQLHSSWWNKILT